MSTSFILLSLKYSERKVGLHLISLLHYFMHFSIDVTCCHSNFSNSILLLEKLSFSCQINTFILYPHLFYILPFCNIFWILIAWSLIFLKTRILFSQTRILGKKKKKSMKMFVRLRRRWGYANNFDLPEQRAWSHLHKVK